MTRFAVLAAVLVLAAPAAGAERLRIGTWNLEWLMTPETFDALAGHCLGKEERAGGADRSFPCDLIPKGRWSAKDLARLRDFAATADLDVIALQETDGREVAKRIWPDYVFCFTTRHNVQNVGFAVRRGIPHRCDRDYRTLGLDDYVRRGADLTLYPGTSRAIRLLSVHLKSACNSEPLNDSHDACRQLQRQVPILEDWIDRRARADNAFAVLGDFNRRFDLERETAHDAQGRIVALWPEIDDGDPPGATLVNPGALHGAVGCGNGFGPREPIDYFVLGRKLAKTLVAGSYKVWDYPKDRRWPDHCLLSIDVEPERLDGL
ncbi:MAG: endonuclease/exonuclease/phosphatase family protein [Steroidobacteraceae bacterium]